jgi:BirA family biotin operon repressor/biotin-[acetyl-CoA-carboxylase] ligase
MGPFGYPRFVHETVTSTNDIARDMARQGVPDGALIVAARQTAGRGRRGASWVSGSGESALMTFVTYPKMPVSQIWRLPIAAGIAVFDALAAFGVDARLKWPNDLLCESRKLGGILVETASVEDTYAALIGIGINVRQAEFPEIANAAHPPGSLAMALGEDHPSVGRLIDAIAGTLPPLVGDCEDEHRWPSVLGRWREALLYGLEQPGIDAVSGLPVRGTLRSVRGDGAAFLESAPGNLVAALPSGTS